MPNFDGKGPEGIGPMSGRGVGFCCGRGMTKRFSRGLGNGRRMGNGGGIGRGIGWTAVGYGAGAKGSEEGSK